MAARAEKPTETPYQNPKDLVCQIGLESFKSIPTRTLLITLIILQCYLATLISILSITLFGIHT